MSRILVGGQSILGWRNIISKAVLCKHPRNQYVSSTSYVPNTVPGTQSACAARHKTKYVHGASFLVGRHRKYTSMCISMECAGEKAAWERDSEVASKWRHEQVCVWFHRRPQGRPLWWGAAGAETRGPEGVSRATPGGRGEKTWIMGRLCGRTLEGIKPDRQLGLHRAWWALCFLQ